MYIPANAVIAEEKLTQYLLVSKTRNDKSKFLARGGFTPDNPEELKAAIRQLADRGEARFEKTTEYGTSFQVKGVLQGVNAHDLPVVLVWFQRSADNLFYFVTLKPDQGSMK